MLKGKRHYGKEGGGEAGGADEIWLAVSMRMSHSSSSLDLELRAYSGLRWHVYVCMYVVVCARMHAHKCSHGPIQQLKSPNFRCWLSHCACVCVLEENESSLASKPQHRSQIQTQIFIIFLSCSEVPSTTLPQCLSPQLHSGLYRFWQLISCVYIDYSLFMVRIGV